MKLFGMKKEKQELGMELGRYLKTPSQIATAEEVIQHVNLTDNV